MRRDYEDAKQAEEGGRWKTNHERVSLPDVQCRLRTAVCVTVLRVGLGSVLEP